MLNKPWIAVILSNKKYDKKYKDGSLASTEGWKRRLFFSKLGVDRETVTHELVHAYLTEMCSDSCKLNVSNLEEIYAELLSKRGYELLTLSESIFKQARNLLTKNKK